MSFEVPKAVLQTERDKLSTKGYEPLEPFFILKEGQVWDERKNKPINFTKPLLEKIANIQNERIIESGDFTPCIVGHTRREDREEQKQKYVGWASRFEVAEFSRKSDGTVIWGVRATPWSKPENKVHFENHPRRSVEMWTDPFLIDPISLLGATTPRLDLGLHQLHRQATDYDPLMFDVYRPLGKLRYELEEDSMPEDNDPTGKPSSASLPSGGGNDVLSQVFNSAEWQQLQSNMTRCMSVVAALEPMIADMNAAPGDQGAAMGGPPGGGMGGPPPGGGMGGPPPGQGIAPGEAAQMNAFGGGGGMAVPGGGNNMVPQQMGRQGAPMQFGMTQQPATYDHRDEQLRVLQQQVISLHLAREGDDVNRLLNELETKIVIDRQDDYNTLIQLERPQRDAVVARWMNIRKPVSVAMPPEGVPIQMHAIAARPGGPMTLQQAHGMVGTPPDPTMTQGAPGAPMVPIRRSKHDLLLEAVRSRGAGGTTVQDAYHALMGTVNGSTSVRG